VVPDRWSRMSLPQQRGEDRNSESRKSWLSDAATIVFVATVTAYAYTYFYEIGFCEAVGFPCQFISIEGRDIVVDLVGQWWIWLVSFSLLLLVLPLSDLSFRWASRQLRVLVLCCFIFAFVMLRPEHRLTTFVGASLVALAVFFIPAAFKTRVHESRLRTLDSVLAWLAFLFMAFHIGVHTGQTERNYLVLTCPPDIVALRVYGDKLVTARFVNKDTGAVENKFRLLNSVDTEVQLETMKKPLHVQK
jgi:hypothetical protein